MKKISIPKIFEERLRVFVIGGRAARAVLETISDDASIEVLGLVEINPEAEQDFVKVIFIKR